MCLATGVCPKLPLSVLAPDDAAFGVIAGSG
jgi:hypothetical protein